MPIVIEAWWYRWITPQIFVANVNFDSGELKVNVNHLSNDNVWNASNSVQSYLGMLKHGNSYSLSCKVLREKGNNVTQQCNISKKR